MPGTPDPVLGSDAVTLVVAVLLAVATTAAMAWRASRTSRPLRTATLLGVGHGAILVGGWALVRIVAYRFWTAPSAAPWEFLLVVGGGLLVLTLQAAVPFGWLTARGVVSPTVGLAAATALVWFLVLRVGGESDPLGLYALAFGPLVVAALLGLGAAEWAVRRALGAAESADEP
ncbi:hypothetical protein [Haloparvum sedimenti]|uniref:hypothetical protein n=1 Tax=Haloparvum sedimenti TaxID=1678448 RepID=UPI00071E9AF9|nr:hypothetical protein [Haloparvum sedimenti]